MRYSMLTIKSSRNSKFSSALIAALLLSIVSLASIAEEALKPLTAEKTHKTAIHDMVDQLNSRHYVKLTLNDDFSGKLLDAFIDDLDPNRLFLLKSDIDEFQKYRTRLDDELKKSDLSAGFYIFNRYRERMIVRLQYIQDSLAKSVPAMDFNVKEDIELDRTDAEWPADQAEANEIWRKQIKNRV